MNWFLLTLMALPAQNPEPPVAMVLTTRGGVQLQRGTDQPRPLRTMDLLRPGDKLEIGTGEALLVLFSDGHQEKVKAAVTVRGAGCAPATAVEKQPAKLSTANLANLREQAAGRGGLGVLRGEHPETPQVVTPLYGAALLEDRPTLTWPTEKGATGYRVELRSGNDKLSIWKETTTEPQLTYPSKQAALKPGVKYLWRVTALIGEEPGRKLVDSKFSLVTTAEAEELAALKPLLEGQDAPGWLLAATTYEAHAVYDRALALYEKLAAQDPEAAAYQTALASYYERAGLMEKAKAAREKARKLGAVPSK